MAQISKYPISKEVADRIFEVFLKTFVEIKSKEDADQFISDFLTPTEKIVLAKRLAIAFLLEKGCDYQTIQKIIKVSAPTIASVNTARKYGNNSYKKIISKIISEEKLMDFFDEAIQKILSIPAQGGKGSGVWRYLKEEHNKQKRRKRKPF